MHWCGQTAQCMSVLLRTIIRLENYMKIGWINFLFICVALSMLPACSGSSNQNNSSQLGGAIQGTPLSLSQQVTTVAGPSPSLDGAGSEARFMNPQGITTDGTSLFVADTSNNTIRKVVISTGVVTTLAGRAGSWGAADGTGTAALFWGPQGIATDGMNLFVADSLNNTIRKVEISTGVVTTLVDRKSVV